VDIQVTTAIVAVTVYPDRALVVRQGEAEVPAAGEHTLRLSGLPLSLLRDSLRAGGSGPAGTRILGVEQAVEFHEAAPEATQAALRAEIERLEQELALLDERQSLQDEQQVWLRSLAEQAAKSLAWGIARGTAKADDAGGVFTYASDEAGRVAATRIELRRQRTQTAQELEARRRELEQLGIGKVPDRLAALVHTELPAPGRVAIELSYLIGGASWRPRYDARVDVPAAATVHLAQQALVMQHTGEEWPQVSLALSTARPAAARQLPDDPAPWYVDVVKPVAEAARMPQSVMRRAMSPMAAGAVLGEPLMVAEPSLAEPAADMEMAAAEVERTGAVQIFRLPGHIDVPSDGQPHTLGIGEFALPATLDYVAMPALTEGAHLRARVRNTSGQVLLAGELHVFQATPSGEEYTGATRLDLTAEDAELTLYLGVDDNVPVKRELIERETDKGSLLQGGIRRITFGYRVTVSNRTTAAQRVVVKDHLPVPRHERVKLKVLDLRPPTSERTRLEQLTWELRLEPGEERRIEWRFVVEAPADLEVLGLP